MKIYWIPHSLNPVFAGVRLRCLIPTAVMKRLGVDVKIVDAENLNLSHASIIVVQAKWLLDAGSPERLLGRMSKLTAARLGGAKLILDSFDNYFINSNFDAERTKLLEAYRQCLSNFDWFVVSSQGLVPYLREETGLSALISVVGDPLEDEKTPQVYERWAQRINPKRWIGSYSEWMRAKNAQSDLKGIRKLMWFGSHGSSYAAGGMSELTRILPLLEEISTRIPFHLSVVSNSRNKFNEIFSGYKLPCSYTDWDRLSFANFLKEQDLVILPIEINEFTASKSNNRLLLALSQGIPVQTDAIPDYVAWQDYCVIGRWNDLEKNIFNIESLKTRVQEIAPCLKVKFSVENISNDWINIFNKINIL
ncbi:hypothetical protein ACVBEH_15850 [Roseateles sp. GG27B]